MARKPSGRRGCPPQRVRGIVIRVASAPSRSTRGRDPVERAPDEAAWGIVTRVCGGPRARRRRCRVRRGGRGGSGSAPGSWSWARPSMRSCTATGRNPARDRREHPAMGGGTSHHPQRRHREGDQPARLVRRDPGAALDRHPRAGVLQAFAPPGGGAPHVGGPRPHRDAAPRDLATAVVAHAADPRDRRTNRGRGADFYWPGAAFVALSITLFAWCSPWFRPGRARRFAAASWRCSWWWRALGSCWPRSIRRRRSTRSCSAPASPSWSSSGSVPTRRSPSRTRAAGTPRTWTSPGRGGRPSSGRCGINSASRSPRWRRSAMRARAGPRRC